MGRTVVAVAEEAIRQDASASRSRGIGELSFRSFLPSGPFSFRGGGPFLRRVHRRDNGVTVHSRYKPGVAQLCPPQFAAPLWRRTDKITGINAPHARRGVGVSRVTLGKMHERTNLPTDSAYTVRDQELMQLARHYFDWQSDLVCAVVGRRPVEIGCGLGNFTAHLLGRDLVIATDVEPACTERLAQRFAGAPNLVVQTLDVLSPEFASLKQYEPDSVVCLNVLEHVEDDALALQHMYQVLSDGGVVVLLVPAFESLYGPIDRLLGHFRRYSKSSLRQLAGKSGFKVNSLRFMNCAGFFGWWFNAHVRKSTMQSEDQIRFFDRYVVPVMRRIEAVAPPPFGQSLFAVLTKQEGAER